MTQRLENLQTTLAQVRTQRDEALSDLRMMKAQTGNEPQSLAEQFVNEFCIAARNRRLNSVDDYMEWIVDASYGWSQQICQKLEGDARRLALAQIQFIATNETAFALSKELSET